MTAVDLAVRAVLALWDRDLPDASAAKDLCVDLGRAGTFITLSQADHVLWLRGVLAEHDASRWVPVTERLPKASAESVLVTYESNGNVFVGEASWGEHTGWFDALGTLPFSVIAWQPLPKPWVKP